MPDQNPEINIYATIEQLSRAAASLALEIAQEAVRLRGRFLVTLSGGSTPLSMYRLMAAPPISENFPWRATHFFWGDERCVSPDDPESNFGQAQRTFLGKFPIPAENIQRVHGELDPQWAAQDYTERLKDYCHARQEWPNFDLVLLGLGSDGHTASLFPGGNPISQWAAPAIAVTANYQGRPANRVTLTPPVFNSARTVMFLVSGEDKASALASTIKNNPGTPMPAQLIHPENGRVIWMVEQKAAKLL